MSKKLIPLIKVVKAAIVDVYGDINRLQQMYSHWAARGLNKLNRETLKMGSRTAVLPINKHTNTATLPEDFEEETFVGIIDNYGKKVRMKIDTSLINEGSIKVEECDDKCPKCQQPLTICNDLQISESVTLVTINGTVYEKTVTKKLYPNGDYYQETSTPIENIHTHVVEFLTEKKFINNLDLKSCGCLETTEENLCVLQECCPSVYGQYYASCDANCCIDEGSYKIFEEQGLIQFSPNFKYKEVYIEYRTSMPKVNGQLVVPEIAFETLVEWVKWKSVENKPNVPLRDKAFQLENYKRESGNMRKVKYRISLSQILQASMRTPKFDIEPNSWQNCFYRNSELVTKNKEVPGMFPKKDKSEPTENTVIYLHKGIAFEKVKFTVGASGSPMVDGQKTLIISDAGIFDGSVNVILGGTVLDEQVSSSIYYTIAHTPTQITITFMNMDIDNPLINLGVTNGQNFTITYAKAT